MSNNLQADILGQKVILAVDESHRKNLSAAHSACHLVSLALNKLLSTYWQNKKNIPKDSLGHYDFDQQAIFSSHIQPNQSWDTYRLGKSLRKVGFDEHRFLVDLKKGQLITQMNQWISERVAMEVNPGVSFLESRRTWTCTFQDNTQAKIPCGGTHLTDFCEVDMIKVSVEKSQLLLSSPKGTYITLISDVVRHKTIKEESKNGNE